MWARRCGVPPRWPSRIKVVLQSFVTAAVGLAVYEYMSQADVGYLDLTQPQADQVLCLTQWPLRHSLESWVDVAQLEDWTEYIEDMAGFIAEHSCNVNATSRYVRMDQCAATDVPLHEMDRNLGIPIGLSGYNWRNDAIEAYGYVFLWMTLCLWVFIMVHDLALLTVRNRDFVYDLRGIRNKWPCWKKLYILLGFRCWRRMFRGRGCKLSCWKRKGETVFCCKRFSRPLSIVMTLLFVAWGILVFFAVIIPVVTIFFVLYPVRLSRAIMFLNCLACGVFGVVLSIHALVFIVSVSEREVYAVTWEVPSDFGGSCVCGCMYPLATGRCTSLLIIGILVAYKAFTLAFRCLKGLRRSNWASLMSVLFPVPLAVYEVSWTEPSGNPIQHRKPGEPVQGELAFDPFALMDEQMDSGRTTVHLFPSPVDPEFEPATWSVEEVETYLEDLHLSQYREAVRKNNVDGATLIELLKSNGLEELGVTSKIHSSRIRSRLSSVPKHGSRSSGRPGEAKPMRNMAGPHTPEQSEAKPQYKHLEYIGCCGFPCRKGENSGRHLESSDESEGEAPAAAGATSGSAEGSGAAAASDAADAEGGRGVGSLHDLSAGETRSTNL